MEENNNKNQQTINIDFAENEQNNKNQSDSIDSQSVMKDEDLNTVIAEEKPKKRRGNPQNLTSKNYWATRTKEEMQEIGRKGGKASALSNLRKKTIREIVQAIGDMPVNDKAEVKITYNTAMMLKQYVKAVQGDTKSVELILRVIGCLTNQDPVKVQQILQISFDKDNQTIDVTPEEPDKE